MGSVREPITGQALSGDTSWPDTALLLKQNQVAPTVGSPFIICSTKTLSSANSVNRNKLVLTETFKPVASLHSHCPIQTKPSIGHKGNIHSMQADAPNVLNLHLKISLSLLSLCPCKCLMTSLEPVFLVMPYHVTLCKDPECRANVIDGT